MKVLALLTLFIALSFAMESNLKYDPNMPIINHTCSFTAGIGSGLNNTNCSNCLQKICQNSFYIVLDFLEIIKLNTSYIVPFFHSLALAVRGGFEFPEKCTILKLYEKITEGFIYLFAHPFLLTGYISTMISCTIQDIDTKDYFSAGVCIGDFFENVIHHGKTLQE